MNATLTELWRLATAVSADPQAGAVERALAFFQAGGPLAFANLLLLACAVAVAAERAIALSFRYGLNAPAFMGQISKLVLSGNVDRAVKLCGAAPNANAPLAKVVRAGLSQWRRGDAEASKAMEEEILAQTPALEQRIGWLLALAAAAIAVGLAGAAAALIQAHRSRGVEAMDRAVDDGAFGFAVAAACALGYLLLRSRARHMVQELELYSLKVEKLLAHRSAGPGA